MSSQMMKGIQPRRGSETVILGLNSAYHEPSACLLVNGKIAETSEELLLPVKDGDVITFLFNI